MDDNVGPACLAQSTLARAGYVVELAPGRAEALTRHAVSPYDVLLIDLDMPGMDGLKVLETLGTWGPFPPTIMVTGRGDEAIAVEAMKRGASDYLIKDVEGRYLILLPAVVARVLQQHCLAAQKRQAEMALQETLTTLEARVQGRTADLRRVHTQLRVAITRRQRAEATLARLSQQHQLILAASSEGIYGIDRQGKVTFINPAAAQMLGWEAEVLHGQVIHDHIHHTRAGGVGMNRATLAHVFEPFYTTKDGQGTGLGLAICQQILDRHGGSIRLASTPGRGTTVTIELQRADAGG
jgi:DNA-binding response OmpR family regulator